MRRWTPRWRQCRRRAALAGQDAAITAWVDVPTRVPSDHPRLRAAAAVQPWCNAIRHELRGLRQQGVETEFRDAQFLTDTARLLGVFHGEAGAAMPHFNNVTIHLARLGIPMTPDGATVKVITGPRRHSPLPCNALIDLDGLRYLQSRQGGMPFDSLRIEEFPRSAGTPVAEKTPGLTGEFGEDMISFVTQRDEVRRLVDVSGRWEPISRLILDAQEDGLTQDAGAGILRLEHSGQRFVALPYPIWNEGAAIHLAAVLRARQFRQIIAWLHQGTWSDYEFPAFVEGAYDLDVMHFRGADGREVVALANLSMDPLEQPVLTLSTQSGEPRDLQLLGHDGLWSSQGITTEAPGQYRLKGVRLEILEIAAIRYRRA